MPHVSRVNAIRTTILSRSDVIRSSIESTAPNSRPFDLLSSQYHRIEVKPSSGAVVAHAALELVKSDVMLYYLVATLYVLACFLLLLVVLLQQGKGGDMASAFGGGGSQTAFGARAGATVLTKATTVLGALFMIGAIFLGIYGQKGPGSVLSGVKGPAAPTPAPVAPAQPGK